MNQRQCRTRSAPLMKTMAGLLTFAQATRQISIKREWRGGRVVKDYTRAYDSVCHPRKAIHDRSLCWITILRPCHARDWSYEDNREEQMDSDHAHQHTAVPQWFSINGFRTELTERRANSLLLNMLLADCPIQGIQYISSIHSLQ
jgi:hypothetical protein